MEVKHKIQLCGFNDNDNLVFSSLLSLLSTRTRINWELCQEGASDLLIIDCSTPEGRRDAIRKEELGYLVVRYGEELKGDPRAKILTKPLRAANLLHCLNEFSDHDLSHVKKNPAEPTISNLNVSVNYKLKRWPSKALLSKHVGASRLCAVFMGRHVSVEDVVQITNISIDRVVAFVDDCIAAQCLEQVAAEIASPTSAPVVNKKNSGLFAKLRTKLIGNQA